MSNIIPLPPSPLRVRVAGLDDEDWFNKSGLLSREDLSRGLHAIGNSISDYTKILEWGCGSGRILRHFADIAPEKEIYGCDVDREAIAWLSANIPWVNATVNDGLPPLPYGDDFFDLVFNHSVMSHLDETYENAWLSELRRITRPEGIVTLSFHGPSAFDSWKKSVSEEDAASLTEKLRKDGRIFVINDGIPEGVFPEYYHTSFHNVGYIFDHWSKYFKIRAYLPQGALKYQDLVVLQKV